MLEVISLDELSRLNLDDEPMVMEPWLPACGLSMVAGPTGLGKTMLMLGVALAIASAGCILEWKAPTKRRVLYVDGEMALKDMQERIDAICIGHPEFKAARKGVFLLSHARQTNGIPNLIRNANARRDIESALEAYGCEVLMLDNLSALCNSEAENDAESWTVMQDWLLKLRRLGYTVVFLHHTGKPDEEGRVKQRGTSKREDVLNTSMVLKPEKGIDAGFQIIFTKHRGFLPQRELYARLEGIEKGFCRILTVEQKKGKKLNEASLDRELAT